MAMPTQKPLQTNNESTNAFRPLANFSPDLWVSSFDSFSLHDSKFEEYTKEVELLKEVVRDMLMQSTEDLEENVKLINSLCYLGVSYHFESEIEKQLNRISKISLNFDHNDFDLNTSAILFRVLRQYGYKISTDVFEKFKDENGEFKQNITNDVKGLLSLYEVSFMRTHGEDILEQALDFTKQHLDILATKSSPILAKHIRNMLTWPFHTSMEKWRSYLYISFYEEYGSPNKALLKFAKLDYNRLQLLYRQELTLLIRWWKELNLMKTLHYTRDRIVESYVWVLGSISEPQFAHCRQWITKHVQLVTVLDDTYDAYGTLDELLSFTAALERFTVDAVDDLPEYMKVFYKALSNHFCETENCGIQGSSFKTAFAIEMLKELAEAYLQEAKWSNDGCIPRVEEYMENALIVSTSDFLASALFLGIDDLGIKEMVWLRNNPKIVKAVKLIGTLKNDLGGHEGEQNRGEFHKSVDCYMNEHSITKEEAIKEIQNIFEERWKDVNEDLLKTTYVSKNVVKYLLNFARMSEFFYKFQIDPFTNPTLFIDRIKTLLLQPLPM